MKNEVCFKVSIDGRVQGVGFRYSTQRMAMRLGLRGWVRNLPDGRVEACICGPQEAVDAMLEWLRHGPRMARVDRLRKTQAPPPENDGFIIR